MPCLPAVMQISDEEEERRRLTTVLQDGSPQMDFCSVLP
jgi:hypothetical protein